MSPGIERRDVSNHHASCLAWLALTTPQDVADEASPFVPGAELNAFLCTLSCGGEHVPMSCFTALVEAFKRLADFAGGQIQCKVFLAMEVGGAQAVQARALVLASGHANRCQGAEAHAKAKAWVHSCLPPRRPGEKRILQNKPCATDGAKDANGTVKCLCKDYGKDAFRASQSGLTKQTWQRRAPSLLFIMHTIGRDNVHASSEQKQAHPKHHALAQQVEM